MKKKIMIVLLISLTLILIVGTMYLIDRVRMKNNKPVIFSTWGYNYAAPVKVIEGENDEKVIILYDKIENINSLDKFFDNTDKYNKNRKSDSVEISRYTIEGDEIITALEYSKEEEKYVISLDNTRDKFAAEEDRKITTKEYSALSYNLVKEIKDDYIYIKLQADNSSSENLENVEICIYNKELEKNKDLERVKVEDSTLIAEDTSIEKLVRYNGILYGQSYGIIDYAGNPEGPIGTINKLVGEEYLPIIDGETNSEELLNSLVDYAGEKSLILIIDGVAVLYTAIDETNHSFEGKVIEVGERYIVVEPNEGEAERKSSDKISIGIDENDNNEYKQGTEVKIIYNGIIMETYPAKINAIRIEIL